MIAHFAIPARDPQRTAKVFGKIIDGEVLPFPVVPGSFVAMARDGSGLGVEVMPMGANHHMGEGEPVSGRPADGPMVQPWEVQIRNDGEYGATTGFHVALTSPLSADELVDLAKAEGWRAVHCERGGVFEVVEIWVDNRQLIEVMPPAGAESYRAFYRPDVAATMFGAAL